MVTCHEKKSVCIFLMAIYCVVAHGVFSHHVMRVLLLLLLLIKILGWVLVVVVVVMLLVVWWERVLGKLLVLRNPVVEAHAVARRGHLQVGKDAPPGLVDTQTLPVDPGEPRSEV